MCIRDRITIPTPEVLCAFPPPIPDGFIEPLVVGAPQNEPILLPDQGVRPVGAGFREHPADQRPLLGAHADIESTVGVSEEVPGPAPAEPLPLRGREGVILDAALLLSLLCLLYTSPSPRDRTRSR